VRKIAPARSRMKLLHACEQLGICKRKLGELANLKEKSAILPPSLTNQKERPGRTKFLNAREGRSVEILRVKTTRTQGPRSLSTQPPNSRTTAQNVPCKHQ
jgi:hypothetical protein